MYYLIIGGVQQGPYPAEKITAMLAAGEIGHDTLAWTEGEAEWKTVEAFFPASASVPAGLPSLPAQPKPPAVTPETKAFLGGAGLILAVVGAILLSLLIVGGGVLGYVIYLGTGLDKSSKAYVDVSVPAIVSRWQPDELAKRESKAFRKATNDQQLVQLFQEFRRLGALKAYNGCQGDSRVNFMTGSGKVITATYLAKATFENGDAQIRVNLIQEDGAWKIQGFRVDSAVFSK